MALPFRLVYHDEYDLHLGAHVFPAQKYRLIRERLLRIRFARPEDFEAPEPAPDEDILLVHEPGWVTRLKEGKLDHLEVLKLEIPCSPEMVKAFWLAAGGTILAARNAVRDRVGFNIGGGFHHAFPGHGEGFCAIHDVAIAIRRLQKDKAIRKAMVVDCDVHHGNGTAAIFSGDPTVFTLSIHQFHNYPNDKPPSDIDIHLNDGAGDQEYLSFLREGYTKALERFQPQIVFYVAGADPYHEDQLGGLRLTMDGLKARDRLVMDTALEQNIPVVITLAGGYASNLTDTVLIHSNTAIAAAEALFDGHGLVTGSWPRPR